MVKWNELLVDLVLLAAGAEFACIRRVFSYVAELVLFVRRVFTIGVQAADTGFEVNS